MGQRISTDEFIDLMAHIDRGSGLITRQTFREMEDGGEEHEYVLHELVYQKPEAALDLDQQFDGLETANQQAWRELGQV